MSDKNESPKRPKNRKRKSRWLERLTLTQKFCFVCLFFFVCFGTALGLLVKEQTHDVAQAKKQVTSIQYQRELMRLLHYIAEHELSAQRYLSGDTSLENVLSHLQQRTSEAYTDLQDVEALYGATLFPDETSRRDLNEGVVTPANTKNLWTSLANSVSNLDPEESATQHAVLFRRLRTMMVLLADSALLPFENSEASHQLGEAMFLDITELQQHLLAVGAIAENAAGASTISAAKREELIELLALAEGSMATVTTRLWKAAQSRKRTSNDLTLKASLEEPLGELSASVANLLSSVKKNILKVDEITVPIGTLAVAAKRAVDEAFQLPETGTEQLERLLSIHLWELILMRRYCIVITSVFAALAMLCSYILLRSVLTPLKRIATAAQEIAQGNMSVRLPVLQYDELGQASQSLNLLTASLQDILSNLKSAGVQLTTSSTEISAAAREQETFVVQQETATKQIAITAKQISTTAGEFSDHIHQVARSSEETSSLAAVGKEGLARLTEIMSQLVEATAGIAEKLASLNEKTGVITGVITTITKVADRTNLLSLNAAIEAHKLGAKGGSFGVIAREIRRLADQTAYATLDIEKVVHQMIEAVSTSVEGVTRFTQDICEGVEQASEINDLLNKIIGQVQQQSNNFESVHQGMEVQTVGAKQITNSIDELSDAAQLSTSSIRQFHTSLHFLTGAIRELQGLVALVQNPSQAASAHADTPPS